MRYPTRRNVQHDYTNEILLNIDNEVFSHPEHFSIFFQERYASIVYFVFRLVKNQQVAEEIAEDAFVVLWQKQKEIKNSKVALAYLYTTAKNAALNWLRNEKRKANRSNGLKAFTDFQEAVVLESMIHSEFLQELHSALNLLPAQCRKIFNLLYLEGKSNHEVAKALKLSVNTVKAQRARGLMILRKKLSFLLMMALCFL